MTKPGNPGPRANAQSIGSPIGHTSSLSDLSSGKEVRRKRANGALLLGEHTDSRNRIDLTLLGTISIRHHRNYKSAYSPLSNASGCANGLERTSTVTP